MRLKKKWKIIFIILLIIFVIIISLKMGTKGLKVREYKIVNKKLSDFYGLKILHFSDLNYGNGLNDKKLEKLINMINDTKPDLVFFTGDLINSKTKVNDDILKNIINNLSKINSTYGKYYVSGDMDSSNYDIIMNNSNFISLDNSFDIIYSKNNKSIFIGGLKLDNTMNKDMSENLNLNSYDYKIFILHYPDKIDEIIKYDFDLILSGHTLNGGVRLPIIGKIYTPKYGKKYYEQYYKIDKTDIYISNGIGNSKLNVRLFNTPSFNLYRLVDK